MAAESAKVLGQVTPAATTLTPIYTVPATTRTVVSSIFVCNRSGSSTTFRISIAIAGAADTPAQYLYYDISIPGNETFASTTGITLGCGDVVRAYVGANTVSISLFGVELTQ